MKKKRDMKKSLLASLLVCSMIQLPSIPAAAAAPTNLALNGTATASSYEQPSSNPEQTSPSKAIDGDLSTHWGTDQNQAAGEWINVNLGASQEIQQINVVFERTDAAQNILGFQVEVANGNDEYTKIYEKNTKASQKETIQLESKVTATDVKVTILDANGGTINWVNAGISEIEIYGELYTSYTLSDVVNMIQGGTTIAADVDTFPLPTVPSGFDIKINGADFEQIIANDGTIFHPLTDKTVKVSYVITDKETKEEKVTDDYTYTVAGRYTADASKNTKPSVIPEIAEWYSDSTDLLATDRITDVVYDNNQLEAVVDEFILDYKDFTGITLNKVKGESKANAFNFSLTAPDALLGEEGYTMVIASDRINVASVSTTGNMYGMQTILQMYRSNPSGFSLGTMRDYPRFQTRGFVLDAARKPVSMDMLKEIARTMRYYKMNDFQVHLSDNYIWLENYGHLSTEQEGFKAYDAFRLESSLTNAAGESPTATDYYFTKAEFKAFIQNQREVGVNIVPEIDVPAHANSFTKIWPELMVSNGTSSTAAGRPLIDHLDISKTETVNKVKEIFDDYTKGSNATFDSETTVHIGADEFLSNYTAYRNFLNEIVPYVKQTNTVRMWGGLSWIKDNPITTINQDAIENVEMNLWSKDWADGIEMYNLGYKLINTIDDFGYMVPNGNMTRSNSYGDFLNVTRIFNEFEPNRLRASSGYTYIPSGDDQALGSAFAIWNDNIDKSASGLSESDLYYRFFDALPFYAEKNWAATGKEKGTASALQTLANQMGTGPNTNPYYTETSEDNTYESYDFNTGAGLDDTSANDRDLTLATTSTATVKDQALVVNGKNSYVTTPIDKLGNGNELSFDITLNEMAKPGDILFEADAAYGTHDIRVMENGKLGFTRELYSYYFDYELPVGKTVNIKIVTAQQSTKLYVNGTFVSSATGSFIHNDMVKKSGITNATFALPLERIGSKTNAIHAVIDNVKVAVSTVAGDTYEKSKWTGSTNSETVYNDTEGKLIYAFDNNSSTIWHSNWKGATDKLTGSNSFYAEINFNQKHTINQFSFTPRTSQASGYVTKADLYIKANESDEWKKVAEDQTFASDSTKKTFYFEEQEVQFVKFVAKASSDGWVAVSEFDIDNVPALTCTVYVTTSEGGTVTGGTEVMSGETVTITATPKEGYEFDGWYNNLDAKVSEEASYTFQVSANIALEARFTKKAVVKEDADLTALQTAISNAEAILTAEDHAKYSEEELADLQEMVDNAKKLTVDSEQSVIDAAKDTITEQIARVQTQFTITATAGEGGSITPNGAVKLYLGTEKEFTVTANEGYHIESIVIDGTAMTISNTAKETFTIGTSTSDRTVTATFAKDEVKPEEKPDVKPEEKPAATEEDKQKAQDYLAECKDFYTEDNFDSEEAWTAYQEAIAALEELLAQGDMTQEALQEAIEAVKASVAAVETPDEPEVPGTDDVDTDNKEDNTTEDDKEDSVQTGDSTSVMMWGIMVVMAALAIFMKRRTNR